VPLPASSGEPERQIARVGGGCRPPLKVAHDGVARRLIDEARRPQARIPVVVGEMVKGMFVRRRVRRSAPGSNATAILNRRPVFLLVPVAMTRAFWPAGALTPPHGMGRQEANRAGRRRRVDEYGV